MTLSNTQRGYKENKKIRNATPLEYDDIIFKSKLEVMCYKVLKEHGFTPLYEEKHFILFEGFSPNVPFYTKNIFKRKNKSIQVISPFTSIDNRKCTAWIYTPDLYFEYNNHIIIVEVKGFSNDVVRYKRKIFRYRLEQMQEEDKEHIYEFWEIHTKTQLLDCINHLKNAT